MAAVTVGAESARIGDGRSTYADGVVSAVNAVAFALGARPGSPRARSRTSCVAAAEGARRAR